MRQVRPKGGISGPPQRRLRLRLPAGFETEHRSMAEPQVDSDEDHSRHMWERCTGESPDNGAMPEKQQIAEAASSGRHP